MPLSEHEQRLLDQIERALYAEDPKFASAVRSSDLKTHLLRRVRRAVVVLVLGLVVLLVGVAVPINGVRTEVVGIAGFAIMLGAGLVIARSLLRMSGREAPPAASRPKRRGRKGLRAVDPIDPYGGERRSMLGRVEDRWNRRRDEQD
ncbi:MAG TPA: DUF3040 domain-containing protein [Mycobacteriales bacterium]|nr:DUF3040 domain-containing protein [Mycobacteriales bacterium]